MTYDQWLAALCVWREARGVGLTAMHAIWWVIQNRATDIHKRWPRTVIGVILQPWQFSSFNVGDANATKFPLTADGSFVNAQAAITADLGGDPTNGANSYESEPPDKLPKWADPSKITANIGPFRFYRL